MKRLFAMLIMSIVLVGFFAAGSYAKTIVIRADQLMPKDSIANFGQYPMGLYANDPVGAYWYKKLKIPVGKRITKLKYFHNGSGDDPFTQVSIFKFKMGVDYVENPPIAMASSSDDTGSFTIPVETTEIEEPRVRKGHTYFVYVFSRNSFSIIRGIKINYTD